MVAHPAGLFEALQPLSPGPSSLLGNHYENTSRETTGLRRPSAAKPTAKKSGFVVGPAPAPGATVATGRTTPAAVRARAERWLMLSALRDLMPGRRPASCHRIMLTDRTNLEVVQVKFSPAKSKASYDNLNACGDVWACPVCSLKIGFKRSELVAGLLSNHFAAGGRLIHIVQTVRHTRESDLSDLLSRISAARQKMHRSREFRALKQTYGYVGSIRALEVTHSFSNGWHPHVHELLLTDDSWYLSRFDRFRSAYFGMWRKYAKRAGLYTVDDACTFDLAADDLASAAKLADYVTRAVSDHTYMQDDVTAMVEEQLKQIENKRQGSSTAAKEIALASSKVGKSESRSHFQLLRDFAIDGDAYAGALFLEFAEAFHNKRQLVFSDGLKAKYGVVDNDDKELAESTEYDAEVIGVINKAEWSAVLRSHPNVRGTILMLADTGTFPAEYIQSVLLAYEERRAARLAGVS